MVPWSSYRMYGNSRKWSARSCGGVDCSYSWVRDVAGDDTPHCTRCSGNWTRYNGKPLVTPGSIDDGNEENGIRRLLEQFLSTLPEDKRAMVRAAMGLVEVVQIAPMQISLKENRAQVEKRQDKAKRIIATEQIGVFHEKASGFVNGEMRDHGRERTAGL